MSNVLEARFRRFWREDGIFLVIILCLFALRFAPSFANGALYAPFRDNVWIYGPIFSRASEIALTGQFPYWLSTILGGFPLYLTPHFSATYPFYFFGLLDYGKAIGSLYTLSYLTCFHLLILYLNFYIMLRVAGAKGLASLCGATIGFVSGNTENYANWITITASYGWFPLLIAGMIRLLRAPLSFWSISLFSLAAALVCTASPSQAVIEATYVSGIFFTAGALWLYRMDGGAAVGRLFCGLGLTGILTFCIAAVAFAPMALATGDMIRHVGNHPPLVGHAPLPWESFNDSQLKLADFFHLFFDSSELPVVGGLYVGPLALLGMTMCPLFYRSGNAFARFLILISALMAAYFLASGFGTHLGLAYLHFHIPLLNLIREAGRYLVIFTAFAVLLAGLGLQAIVDVADGTEKLVGSRRKYFWIATAFSLGSFAVAVVFYYPKAPANWLVLLALPLAFFLIPASTPRLISNGLVLLACLASVLSPPKTRPFSTSQYLSEENLKSHRVLARLAQIPDIRNYRVAISDRDLRPPFWGNNASYYGIRTFYALVTPQPYDQFQEMFDDRLPNLRELRGAKYFVCGQKTKPLNPRAHLLFEESGYRVYQVPTAMEPYALVHQIQPFENEKSFRRSVIEGFNYHRIAGLPTSEKSDAAVRAAEVNNNANSGVHDFVEPILHTANLIGMEANSTEAGLLVLNERWSKAWHARINSRPAEVRRVNFTHVAVAIGAGRNYVEFEYKPMLFWYLLLLQRTAVACLVVGSAWQLIILWRGTGLRFQR